MNLLEKLMSEYDNELTFEFVDMPKGIPGYIKGRHVSINANMPFEKSLAILAEELGHYETSVGDITNYKDSNNMKQEIKARRWGYRKLIPYSELKRLIDERGSLDRHEIAEHFSVPDKYVVEAIEMYRVTGHL
ncbi:ImmA/IrrE family metallo-endopeptidase [Ruoffia tabacinasalis]|uniref:ImmA/IrrE family metallo-endopeptidase n=1 Tax=Ruoffia tabacinasalis TaxID=87458 RepID=A0A5R9EJZ6_9LACT|nr:ImmA/IrrE family metallo-endopeptidase [Ruoffia tabacinasalis]TLQ49313.1 ImmA/IrrE family metallo-endopeptidase [Ruoffia tabacinasalis]